jgi:hypothetical protein
MVTPRHKWMATRAAEAFGLDADDVASKFLDRDTAADIDKLLDGSGPSCLYVYYQPRDVRTPVRVPRHDVAFLSQDLASGMSNVFRFSPRTATTLLAPAHHRFSRTLVMLVSCATRRFTSCVKQQAPLTRARLELCPFAADTLFAFSAHVWRLHCLVGMRSQRCWIFWVDGVLCVSFTPWAGALFSIFDTCGWNASVCHVMILAGFRGTFFRCCDPSDLPCMNLGFCFAAVGGHQSVERRSGRGRRFACQPVNGTCGGV